MARQDDAWGYMGLVGAEESVKRGIRPILRAAALTVLPLFCGACSISLPIPSLINDTEVTGSIVPKTSPQPLSKDLDVDDRSLAATALDEALDPLRTGASVAWKNPSSGLHGTVSASGEAFVKDEQVCRGFSATLQPAGDTARKPTRFSGHACRVGGGSWTIMRVSPLDAGQG